MSTTDTPHPWNEAATKAAAFTKFISDVAGPLRVCGSLRRRKPTVGDIEIVTCPPNRAALLARLDTLVRTGVAEKAVYDNGTYRWGEKYAGLDFQGIRVEVFSATPDNVGYITWLRTGPGDGNTYVMQALMGWPVRFGDDMAWHCTYEKNVKTLQHRLQVPNEATLFALLGMETLAPERRTVDAYKKLLKKTRPSEVFLASLAVVDESPKRTLSLF